MNINAEFKEILGGTYGGPSLSYEDDKFVVYRWTDAPPGMKILGSGATLSAAIRDFKWRQRQSQIG